MVASAVFITDLQGKAIISRNYRGDVPLTQVIETFAKYLVEVDDEAKKPVFHVDVNGDVQSGEDVGATGTGGEHFVYVSVSTDQRYSSPFLNYISELDLNIFNLGFKCIGGHLKVFVPMLSSVETNSCSNLCFFCGYLPYRVCVAAMASTSVQY